MTFKLSVMTMSHLHLLYFNSPSHYSSPSLEIFTYPYSQPVRSFLYCPSCEIFVMAVFLFICMIGWAHALSHLLTISTSEISSPLPPNKCLSSLYISVCDSHLWYLILRPLSLPNSLWLNLLLCQ